MDKNDDTSVQIFNISLFGGTQAELLSKITNWLDSKKEKKWIATVNPEFIMKAGEDRHFFDILQKTDLNVVDGKGLAWAIKVKRHRKVEVIPGSDLMAELCRIAAERGYSVYFLGGWEDRARQTAWFLKRKYPGLKIAGYYAGQCRGNDQIIRDKIGNKYIDILFVAYGMKTQEEWIERNLRWLKVGLVIGVGRSFDYYSGALKRAPKVWRQLGLEWLYSLIQEPKRWRRQLVLPKFALKVLFPASDQD